MKVAYNACFGGFGLSEAGMRRYAEIKGLTLYPERDKLLSSLVIYWTVPPEERPERYSCIYDRDLDRADPALIQVIEELGDNANGFCADLAIRDVPSGARYRIDEYDGNERVVLVDEYEWKVAR